MYAAVNIAHAKCKHESILFYYVFLLGLNFGNRNNFFVSSRFSNLITYKLIFCHFLNILLFRFELFDATLHFLSDI